MGGPDHTRQRAKDTVNMSIVPPCISVYSVDSMYRQLSQKFCALELEEWVTASKGLSTC